MTALPSHEAIRVVLEPAPGPHPGTWTCQVHGPLEPAALEHALTAAQSPDPARWHHHLVRHTPEHHTLRLTPAQETPAATVPGRLADLLTRTPPTGHPLTPAQYAVLPPTRSGRYEAVYLEPATAPQPRTVREALRAVLAAHPQLRWPLDLAGGRLTGQAVPARPGAQDPHDGQEDLVVGEFTDEAGFTAAVAAVGYTLDPRRGVHLRALLARDRRPDGPGTDRLVLVAHELAVDAASWRTLLDDLTTALATTTASDPAAAPASTAAPDRVPDSPTTTTTTAASAPAPAPEPATAADAHPPLTPDPTQAPTHSPDGSSASSPAPTPDSASAPAAPAPAPAGPSPAWRAPGTPAGWVAVLRELARDPAEARHWAQVAESRSHTTGTGRPTTDPATMTGLTAETGPATAPGPATTPGPATETGLTTAPAPARRTGFTLGPDDTDRLTRVLAPRLGLSAEQLLTGVFALALAHWQERDEVSLDVVSDPRTGHPELRHHVGRLTGAYPVHLGLEPGLDPLGRLAAASGALAAAAGRAAAGGGFGACREWSPDPLLRDTLRSLPPAPACLTLHGPHEPLPHHARRVAAPRCTPYPVHAGARFTGSGLRLELDWLPDAARTVTATPPPALAEQLHQLLRDLAQAAGAPIPSAFAPTPQQTALFTGADARPGTGRHVEQLVWVWHGPLDTDRFTAAWQSVFDHESVLRTAFLGGARPQLMVHSRVTVEITRRLHRAGDWSPLLERDRLRGFDLRRPGALRLMLLEPGPARPTAASLPTRIVLTYHRALIDTWSAHLLLREFYRAYLAGGTLPGGERRPDLRDYSAWLAAQDRGAGREFTARTTPPAPPASRPARPAPATGLSGVGRARLRLDAAETSRLAHWAGRWGTTESSVLQAVWAMLIYRACGAGGPAPVFFAVSVPGRGIPLDGADRMPGPLRNALPVHIEVDPAHTVPRLLRTLRDRALDMAAYEWVFGDFLHPDTTATDTAATAAAQAGTLIVFEDPPHPLHALHDDLAAHGIRAEFAGTVPARSVLPLGLLAHHDDTGGLVVTTVHDRALLDEDAAAELLVQSAMLLRELPQRAEEFTTVAEALKLLEGRAVPRMAGTWSPRPHDALRTLRAAAAPQAGAICLIPPPGTPASCYDLLPPAHRGPQELLVLTPTPPTAGAADAGGAAGVLDAAARSALAARAGDRPLLLGGFSGAGALACALARSIAADGHHPPRVVLAGTHTDDEDAVHALARALQDATTSDT
ncbi:condensation domain-containing protein [Streptomyces longwoodensis]|uniref:condensation domain-containing protein n=1 Tax=Streptomyces longwoodensis TaxID=68231 RepID=UPI002ED6B917|nr:condensation domain-containing protein [Streptomyces longwoodensis]